MRLGKLPFGHPFSWNNKKWKAIIAPKKPPKKAYKILCAELPQGDWLWMPSGRNIKPVIRANKEKAHFAERA